MGKYDDLQREQLIELLEKQDRRKKLGLVWERDEIEADKAVDQNFIAATLDESLSDKLSPWRNLVIEGDNFDALRWLRMTYAGRIKCIYVDPPYNTGSKDWVYNDNYMDKEDRYRFSTWLEFLYRRFTIARELLTDDGVVLVSINDENRALMELMLDQALPGMRIASFVWRGRTGGNEGGEHFISVNHEHILVYGKEAFRFEGTKKSFAAYSNPDDHPDGDWTSSDLSVAVAWDDPRAGKGYYPIRDPDTDIWYPCNPDRVWGFVSRDISGANAKIKTQFMEELIDEKKIKFPENGEYKIWHSLEDLLTAIDNDEVPRSGKAQMLRVGLPKLEEWVGRKIGFGTPRLKKFRKELRSQTQPISSWVVPQSDKNQLDKSFTELVSATYDEGAKAIKEMFSAKAFNYAKPPSLIRELIRQSSSSSGIIVDFFAGSATTAQAVMELNAEDGGDRKFIMVSSTEATTDEPDKNLCRDITAERIRKLNASEDKKYTNLAAEFAYLKTREIDFENIDYDLSPAEAWNALEAIHGLPLTPYDRDVSFNEHGGETQSLIYVDRVDEAVFERIDALVKSKIGVTIYSWSPGQLRDRLKGHDVEVQSVRSTLVRKFQQ